MARRVAELDSRLDNNFVVFKLGRTRGAAYQAGNTQLPVMKAINFPTANEVWDEVNENWGGGTYIVKASSRPGVILKTYVFNGPPRVPKPEVSPDEDDPEEDLDPVEAVAQPNGAD
jgi:hypothetical protein